MPSSRAPSQPESRTPGWLQREPGRGLVADVQRMAIPELTRVFGPYGLYLRPAEGVSEELSGNMLGTVLTLHRDADRLAGQLCCLDAALPISNDSLSLVYALFMLESSPDPAALLQEIARTLKPEGVALLISLNPWSLAQLRWLSEPGRVPSSSTIQRLAHEAGLEVARKQYLGPYWPCAGLAAEYPAGRRWFDGLRAARMVVLRRRETTMTPLRKQYSAVSLRPGMSAG